MPMPCANPGLKRMVVALRTVKTGVLGTTLYTPNYRGYSALQGHGTSAAISFSTLKQEKWKYKPRDEQLGRAWGGAVFATVDPPRSRCLGHSRGKKMALEKRVVGGE